jgi:lysophospholipase L1-like esterase
MSGHAQDLGGQQSGNQPVGMVQQPCPPALELPAAARDLLTELFLEPRKLTPADFDRLTNNPQFRQFSEANRLRAANDWAGLCRYRAANASASSASPGPIVVFMGDSITENWAIDDPAFFDHGIVGRGISGQTTAQMLVRFQSDVIALRPRTVHILGGTNDIAGNTGPTSAQDYENNMMSMVEIARAHQIRVILGSIPPTAGFNWRPEVDPKPWIRQLNAWLRAYAARSQVEFIDYYSILAGPSGELRADLSNDGVHPNRSGYRLMRARVEKEILRSDR